MGETISRDTGYIMGYHQSTPSQIQSIKTASNVSHRGVIITLIVVRMVTPTTAVCIIVGQPIILKTYRSCKSLDFLFHSPKRVY